jgi:hypothetical protein
VVLVEDDMPHSACVRCATCDGFPCLVHAKSDAEVLGVRPALKQRNVELLINAEALGLETNTAGTAVTGVVVDHGGITETYTGDIVVVACGAANSAKLLLASASDAHPNGLANGSDMVGRNYMFHNSQAVLALSKEPNPTVFQKTLGLNDFYFGAPGIDHPLGNIQMVGKSSAEMYRGEKPLQTKLAPERTLRDVARHAVDFWLSTEDLPRLENRVTLRRDGRVQIAYTPTNDESKKQLLHELKALLGDLGMHHDHPIPRHAYLKNDIPGRGRRAPGRDMPRRPRSGDLGAEHGLPRARGRQPLRRRHELLPEHRRRGPGADGDGERAARRRSSARAPRRPCRPSGGRACLTPPTAACT